jgi:DNA repair protein RadC
MDVNLDMERTYTIKDLPISERPREKLYSYGVESLSNAELLAIIIRTGYGEKTAIDLAQTILNIDDKGLPFLTNVSLEQLTEIKGVGKCKAAQILSAI